MKKIFAFVATIVAGIFATVVCTLNVQAQVSEPNCVGYSAKIFENTVNDLSESNQKLLLNKVDQIIARNSAGKVALYNAFSVVAQFAITDDQMAETGMQNVYMVKGELTLFAISNVDNSRYGSTIVNLTGSGKTKELATKGLLQNIKATDAIYAKFLKSATSKIIDYYNANLNVVIKKAETLIAQEKYSEAMNFLHSIPECVPAYMQSAEAIKQLAEIVTVKSCESGLDMAYRYYEMKDYDKAREILETIKPDSKCSARAMELAKLLGGIEPEVVPVAVAEPVAAAPVVAIEPVVAPVAAKSEVKVENGFKNVNFSLNSCIGNPNDQSIEVVVLVKHDMINQKFYTNRSEIYLPDGEKIIGSSPSESMPTGIVVKLVYKFRGILPSVKELPMLSLNMHRSSANNSESQLVNFRNIPISWN